MATTPSTPLKRALAAIQYRCTKYKHVMISAEGVPKGFAIVTYDDGFQYYESVCQHCGATATATLDGCITPDCIAPRLECVNVNGSFL